MRLKTIALLFGVILIIVGILGFIPVLTPNNLLLGVFEVDSMHNIVHIVTGLFALIVMNYDRSAALYFLIVGVIYALITIVGFATNGDLYMMRINMADNFLHLAIAIFTLWVGFYYRESLK
jgi:hypothetical protein